MSSNEDTDHDELKGEDSSDYSDIDDSKPITAEQLSSLDKITVAKKPIAKRPQEKADSKDETGVIYLGHIPYGFFEEQMKAFFSQFGVVKRLVLARNTKTGNSKHFGFIEFESKEVAEIVAETMDNYMMFGRTLQCHFVPKADVDENTFRRRRKKVSWLRRNNVNREAFNADRTPQQTLNRIERLTKKDAKRRETLKSLGIEYDFEGYTNDTLSPGKKRKQVDLEDAAPKKRSTTKKKASTK